MGGGSRERDERRIGVRLQGPPPSQEDGAGDHGTDDGRQTHECQHPVQGCHDDREDHDGHDVLQGHGNEQPAQQGVVLQCTGSSREVPGAPAFDRRYRESEDPPHEPCRRSRADPDGQPREGSVLQQRDRGDQRGGRNHADHHRSAPLLIARGEVLVDEGPLEEGNHDTRNRRECSGQGDVDVRLWVLRHQRSDHRQLARGAHFLVHSVICSSGLRSDSTTETDTSLPVGTSASGPRPMVQT